MTVDELVARFDFFDDWDDRYRYIIDLGRKLNPLDDAAKIEENKVRGCISQVWLTCRTEDERLRFEADSDSTIVKGLIAIVLMLHDDRSPAEVLSLDVSDLFDRLGLGSHVTVNRRNGFYSMLGKLRSYAESA
jgi:cysteine desulfuration protein SufE